MSTISKKQYVLNMIKLIDLLKEAVTFNIERRKLNIPLLIKKGAIFITYPHGDDGWETNDEEDWSYSIITLVNVKDANPKWQGEGNKPEYTKNQKPINELKKI